MSTKHEPESARECYFAAGGVESDIGPRALSWKKIKKTKKILRWVPVYNKLFPVVVTRNDVRSTR